MSRSRRWFANKSMTMIGSFVTSPNNKLYVSGYEWRHMETTAGRRFMKRELRRFRRADGKRRINEAVAFIIEDDLRTAAEADALLNEYDAMLYADSDPDDCPCCRPDNYWQHEDYDYWANYDEAIFTNEDRYQQEMAYLDWGYEAHQEALRAAYLAGYQDGLRDQYTQAS